MALHAPKTILLHAVVATFSSELITIDELIHRPNRLPTELLLIIRAHLLSTLTIQLFQESTRALTEYEEGLQHLLCPDCISYNHDIYGPDIWQWQQFSGPCHCIQTHEKSSRSSISPQQFASPHHWLENHLSLQIARLSSTPSPPPSVWDVVTDVLHRHHCELFREDLDDFTAIQGTPLSPSGINVFYYRRVIDYYGTMKPRSPPSVRIRPLNSSLRFLEDKGIGQPREVGDTFRTDIILCRASRDLGLDLELMDIFSSPREPPAPTPSWVSCKPGTSDIPAHKAAFLRPFSNSPVLHGVVKAYSFLSTVLGAFVSMPVTIATLALTIVCFYSRPIALRVGV
ncbi:hypothetical protein D9756_005853 [Leucocoprinus leucothites]|uniref:Uncharacterized protein n=1 Tax=Leucocoprinus leucothites TaxID=201217 RepID=A0A8H5D2Y0_9AGAR|nr:hypothetical protein D9756_005853 [Leucoagaricus leucothites]